MRDNIAVRENWLFRGNPGSVVEESVHNDNLNAGPSDTRLSAKTKARKRRTLAWKNLSIRRP
jgi:hypothetical protein